MQRLLCGLSLPEAEARMLRAKHCISMAAGLHRIFAGCGAALVLLNGVDAVSESARAAQGYRFRGVQAPQVQPKQLANELNEQLGKLQVALKQRSIRTTLTAAIEQSLLHNPELALAYSQIQQSEWSLIAVRRQWYPNLNASAVGPAGGLWGAASTSSSNTRTTNSIITREQFNENRDAFAPSFNLSWTFFDPSRGPQINAAGENLRSQQLLFNVSARNLVLQTQLSYFELQEQFQLIKAYEQILEATTRQTSQSEALFNMGNASLADVEQIRTQQYQTLSLLIATYLAVIDAAASLAQAMALQPGQLALPEDNLAQYGDWQLSIDSTIQQAQRLREEVQSSLAQANSANWRSSALLNRYWPRLALAANGSFSDGNSRTRLSSTSGWTTLDSSTWNGAVGIGLSWSIFDGGIAAAEAQAQRALARQFSDQSALTRLVVSKEVEQSYASYVTSQLALISSREQAESAREAAEAVRERFNVGYADTTSVVQTLNQAITAANAYARSQREYNSSVARLYRASAQWPGDSQALLDRRIKELKKR